MRCPHCRVSYHENPRFDYIGKDKEGAHAIIQDLCPACERLSLIYVTGPGVHGAGGAFVRISDIKHSRLIYPAGIARDPVPETVPAELRADYEEAALLLSLSAKASAALSRRCLQNTIRATTNIERRTLDQEIREVIEQNLLPTDLAEQLDAVRHIGNMAAHPTKNQETAAIIDVEPAEAEWNLDVLDSLFEYWYERPAKIAERKAALNKKLEDAGKPLLP